jgi:acyl carrier protein
MKPQPTFAEFGERFVREFDLAIPADQLLASLSLRDDLAFDSIMYFELLVVLEDVAGFTLQTELIAGLRTVGDVFDLLSQYGGGSAPE